MNTIQLYVYIIQKELSEYLQEVDFTVRIENTDSTFPAITHRQIDHVIVQGDTTIDFTVANAATVYLLF